MKWRVFFADDAGNISQELHVSRFGTFGLLKVNVLGNGCLPDDWEFTWISNGSGLVRVRALSSP